MVFLPSNKVSKYCKLLKLYLCSPGELQKETQIGKNHWDSGNQNTWMYAAYSSIA